ncbi:hypothetical protein NXY40_21660, partial [Phocaeicola vulgatus]|nr:hypothetical protein [Phocaeicola vulgatus]
LGSRKFKKADQISWYKAMNLYEKGYNIVFKVNEANEVTVESQPAWKHASYGEVLFQEKVLWKTELLL